MTMGLDMYLTAEKHEYESDYRGNMQPYPPELEAIVAGGVSKRICRDTSYLLGYWRKANMIHAWIVNNCADGVDECQNIEMTEDKIEELHTLCREVIEMPWQAPNLLPTEDGFFFGSQEYDQGYMDQIKYTKDLLERVLEMLREDDKKGYQIIYQASW